MVCAARLPIPSRATTSKPHPCLAFLAFIIASLTNVSNESLSSVAVYGLCRPSSAPCVIPTEDGDHDITGQRHRIAISKSAPALRNPCHHRRQQGSANDCHHQ